MIIKVPEMGEGARIEIRRNTRHERQTGGGERAYSRVAFVTPDGVRQSYSFGSPVMHLGARYPTLYDTVHVAMSFLDTDCAQNGDGMNDADGWIAHTAIPIGTARVYRHEYRVISDGNGGSDTTKGRITKGNVPLTRFYEESIGVAVSRCLAESGRWEDAGTLDCSGSSDPERDDLVWQTLPVELPYGTEVSHTVSWRGDITRQLAQLRREFKVAGLSW